MKMRHSPQTPYRVKAKGKENKSWVLKNPLSPRGRARTRELRREAAERYDLAGAAAAELTRILGAPKTPNNLRMWACYCYHHDIDAILDKAYEIASYRRQGYLHDSVTAFQHWLSDTFKKGGEQ